MQLQSSLDPAVRKNIYDFINRSNVNPPSGASPYLHSNILQLCNTQPQNDPRLIQEENENLRALINNLNATVSRPPEFIEKTPDPPMPVDMSPMVQRNNSRIRELEDLIARQRAVIEDYQKGFGELEISINNLRTLDADIYKRLSTHDSNFHNRVYELRRALHSGAPYERLMRMIEDIK